METNATKRTDIYQIDPRNVVVMQDFNVRRDFDLDELKDQIIAKGVLNPISVIPFKDEDGVEKYKLVDGERRYRSARARGPMRFGDLLARSSDYVRRHPLALFGVLISLIGLLGLGMYRRNRY